MVMDIEQFWRIVEQSGDDGQSRDNEPRQHELLQQLLETQSPDEVATFHRIFSGYARLSYRAALWAAFYIKEGGCSDDAFDYCRYQLIAAGRATFDRLAVEPDRLAEPAYTGLCEYELLCYAADKAHEKLTGTRLYGKVLKQYPRFDMDGEYRRLGLDPAYKLDTDPVMKLDFDNGEAMKTILPNVWATYGDR